MTIKSALKTYNKIEVELLLSFVLKKSKEFLFTHPQTELATKQLKTFKALVARRKKGEPVAYLFGYKDFFGLRFKVTVDTLIPRPETEWLVGQALSLCHPERSEGSKNTKIPRQTRNDNNIQILDVGTGSGCIAISIKKSLKNSSVTAIDISDKALTVAKYNAKKHKTKIKFLKSNLFTELGTTKFDVIIANLPYVPIADFQKLKPNLKYEPKSAITDNTNDFKIYKEFFEQVKKYLNVTGIILLEIDPKAKKYISLFVKEYFPNYKPLFYKDLNQLTRYVEIKTK